MKSNAILTLIFCVGLLSLLVFGPLVALITWSILPLIIAFFGILILVGGTVIVLIIFSLLVFTLDAIDTLRK